MVGLLLLLLLGLIGKETAQDLTDAIIDVTSDDSLDLFHDPPNMAFSPTKLAIFVAVTNAFDDSVWKVYYTTDTRTVPNPPTPTFGDSYATFDEPYIEMGNLFQGSRRRRIKLVAYLVDLDGIPFRSKVFDLAYDIEAEARPNSYGFLVPGLESNGYFLKMSLEMAADARAQASGGQEFADFSWPETGITGIGPYNNQIIPLRLLDLDPSFKGYEGGFAVNITKNGVIKHWGILVPYSDGNSFSGKVIRIDLEYKNQTECFDRLRMESYDENGNLVVTGNAEEIDACVMMIDLGTIHYKTGVSAHADARGFIRGFANPPYGYLSPGRFNIPARLDFANYGLATTKVLDLGLLSTSFGGYSGGFTDGTWACFSPFKTFTADVGGIRSAERVDLNHTEVYFGSTMLCLNTSAWDGGADVANHVASLDFSILDESLRGFPTAIRVGRFAYFCALTRKEFFYTKKLVRVDLGLDVGATLRSPEYQGAERRTLIDVLDIAKYEPTITIDGVVQTDVTEQELDALTPGGFSDIFSTGHYLHLVPYRKDYEPRNGQRGHGLLTVVNMNNFTVKYGLKVIDLTTSNRNQIPSSPDTKLRGFITGFASGHYGVLLSFFNGVFSGKLARYKHEYVGASDTEFDLQEIDMSLHRPPYNQTFVGYRGMFTSIWFGKDE